MPPKKTVSLSRRIPKPLDLRLSTQLAPGSVEDRLLDVTKLRNELQQNFHAYEEVQVLPQQDRDDLFSILWDAQTGDTKALDAIYSLVYEEPPVPMEEFILGRRYLNLQGLINPEKIEILVQFDKPQVRKLWCAAGSGSGKALALDTRLPTPTGWTTMGEVRPGDDLLDEQGRPCRVLAATDVMTRDAFRVTFDDRTSIVASGDHLWKTLSQNRRKHVRRKLRGVGTYASVSDWRDHWGSTETLDTWKLAERAQAFDTHTRRNWCIPCARPLVGTAWTLPVPPYTLGAWLGDGTTIHAALTVSPLDAPEMVASLAAEGVTTRERPSARRPGSTCYGLIDGPTEGLRSMGVLGDKHIPIEVLRGDDATRFAVLQGLMDTDGFMVNRGKVAEVGIDLTHQRLAADVAELVRTFGWKARCRQKPAMLNGKRCGTVYMCRFRPDRCVFRLQRKQVTITPAQASRHTARWITSMEPVGPQEVRCVMVDSPSHLYLAGEAFIPTHNSFMVSIAMARQIYNLMCLRRPDLFYLLGPGSRIAIINLSVSKEQARDVIFSEFLARISLSPWFTGRYKEWTAKARFPKRIYAFSGGSAAISYYGYHTIFGSLDEASFLVDRQERSVAEELTEALLKSLNTRFPRAWKLMVISTLRSADDYLVGQIERIKDEGIKIL